MTYDLELFNVVNEYVWKSIGEFVPRDLTECKAARQFSKLFPQFSRLTLEDLVRIILNGVRKISKPAAHTGELLALQA